MAMVPGLAEFGSDNQPIKEGKKKGTGTKGFGCEVKVIKARPRAKSCVNKEHSKGGDRAQSM